MSNSTKTEHWPEPIGRVLVPGVGWEKVDPYRDNRLTIRSYEEFDRLAVSTSNNYWAEGEPVYTRSQVERIIGRSVHGLRSRLRRAMQEADGPDYSKAEEPAEPQR